MIKLAETLNPDQCEKFEIISSKIIGDYPNNYTFTKALAEQIVQKFSSKMKIAIVRPSIISTSFHEPLPGYTDNVSELFMLLFVINLVVNINFIR
jgi:nucleoside-diphosphate-sugar epimerase